MIHATTCHISPIPNYMAIVPNFSSTVHITKEGCNIARHCQAITMIIMMMTTGASKLLQQQNCTWLYGGRVLLDWHV